MPIYALELRHDFISKLYNKKEKSSKIVGKPDAEGPTHKKAYGEKLKYNNHCWRDRACIFYEGTGSRVLSNFQMVNIELDDFIFKETRITSAKHAGLMHERI